MKRTLVVFALVILSFGQARGQVIDFETVPTKNSIGLAWLELVASRLAKECPIPREVEPPDVGPIRQRPMVGGLHHRYYREAA